jgi:hypothetical protein
MTPSEAMRQLEGDAFAAYVNLASDLKTFLRAVESRPEVQALKEAMKTPGMAEQVAARIEELTRLPGDADREHPADASLAAYLWLLQTADHTRALSAAAALRAESFWWARKVAERLDGLNQPGTNGAGVSSANPATTTP